MKNTFEGKVAIVNEMVKMGYCLFNETPEHFANRFDVQTLKNFYQAFASYKD